MNQQKQIIGISFMVLHCLMITLIAVIIKHLSSSYSVIQLVFCYNFVSFIGIFLYTVRTNQLKSLRFIKPSYHILRASLGLVSLYFYFYASTITSLTEARSIALTSPLVTSVFAIMWLKEKSNLGKTIALALGFIGAMIILRPGDSEFSFAAILVICAVLMWGVTDNIIKLMSKTSTTLEQLFFLTGLVSLFAAPFALMNWHNPDSLIDFSLILTLGILFLINVIALFLAFKFADVTTIMPFDFSGMIFTAIISYFLFGETMDLQTTIGSAIILISTIYVARTEGKKTAQIEPVSNSTTPQEN